MDEMKIINAKIDYIIDLIIGLYPQTDTDKLEDCKAKFERVMAKYEAVPIDASGYGVDFGAYGFSEEVQGAINEWLEYKAKRGKRYKDRGLTTLLANIEKQVRKDDEQTVIAKIRNSIEHNWQGICWDSSCWFKDEIDNMFNKTIAVSPNQKYREGARAYYKELFANISDKEKALKYGRVIYTAFKQYVDDTDEKYIANFKTWLENEVPRIK